MPCCGQKRDSLRSNTLPGTNSSQATNRWSNLGKMAPVTGGVAYPVNPHSVVLEYTESSPIVVEGSATRNRYEFSASKRMQVVDSRDAQMLLRSRFFVRK
jgi:hypothetical protein